MMVVWYVMVYGVWCMILVCGAWCVVGDVGECCVCSGAMVVCDGAVVYGLVVCAGPVWGWYRGAVQMCGGGGV